MKLTITTDASHFDINKYISYAFIIKGKGFSYKDSWVVPINVSSSTEAEFIAVEKAIIYLFNKWVYYDSIIIALDNIWVTRDEKKYKTKKLLPHIKSLNKVINNYEQLIKEKYIRKYRPIIFSYVQSRKWTDKYGYQRWCDQECKRVGRLNTDIWMFRMKIWKVKCFYNEWFNCVVPFKKDYKKSIEWFYNRNYYLLKGIDQLY